MGTATAPATAASAAPPRRLWLDGEGRAWALGLGGAALVGALLPLFLERLSPGLVPLLVPGLALLGIVVVLAFARPEGVVVAAFALLSVVRSEPAPSDLLFAVLMLTGLVTTWRPRAQLDPLLLAALAAFGLLSLASSLNAVDVARALTFEAITLYGLLLAVWLAGAFRLERLTRRAVKAYVLTAAVSAVLGALAVKVHFPGSTFLTFGTERAQGLFEDPNVFGPFLVPAAAIVLEELGRPRLLGYSTRRLGVLLAALVAGVVFAFSRGGWLNLAIAFITVVVVYSWRLGGLRVALRTGGALALCGLVGLGFLAASGSLSFLKERAAAQGYDTQRFGTQAVELQRATKHVLGYGPGQSETTLGRSTHSLYVRTVYESGLIGLAALVLVLGVTLAGAAALAVRDGDVHGVGSAALLGSWLGLLANSFFVDTLHWRHLWVVAALIWAGAFARRAQPGAPGV